ncbi:MAG: hypothetical protein AB7S47_00130 [Desulfurella sp.]
MFIKRIEKKNKGSDRVYAYYRLMESYRTPNDPRQRKILDLGALEGIDPKDHKKLADLIEDKVNGKERLFSLNPHLEELASYFASLIVKKDLVKIDSYVKDRQINDTCINVYESSIAALSTKTIGAVKCNIEMHQNAI